jgi:hypothetical protein
MDQYLTMYFSELSSSLHHISLNGFKFKGNHFSRELLILSFNLITNV